MIHIITPQIDNAIHRRLQPGQKCRVCEWLKAVHISRADVYLVLIDGESRMATVGCFAPEGVTPSNCARVKLRPVEIPYYEVSLN